MNDSFRDVSLRKRSAAWPNAGVPGSPYTYSCQNCRSGANRFSPFRHIAK
jgi:hypothetical protein